MSSAFVVRSGEPGSLHFATRTVIAALAALVAAALPDSAQPATFNFDADAPVPEVSTTVSLGVLPALGIGGMAWTARKRRVRA